MSVHNVRWVFAAIASVFSFLLLVAVAWAIPRGFDWTDEAWVYSLIASNRVTVGEPWAYQHLLHYFFEAVGQNIVAFRIVRFVIYILLGLLTSFVFFKISKLFKWNLSLPSWITILAFSQMGTFIVSSYAPRYIGYNEIAAWFTQLIALAVVYLAALILVGRKSGLTSNILWMALGFMTSILLGAKITTFVAMSLLVVVVIVLLSRSLRELITNAVLALSGVVIGGLLLLVISFPFRDYFANLIYVFTDSSAQDAYDHPIPELLGIYAASFADALKMTSLAIFAILILGIVLAAVFAHSLKAKVNTGLVLGASLTMSIWSQVSWPRSIWAWTYLGYMACYLLFALIILGCVGIYIAGKAPFGEVPSVSSQTEIKRWRIYIAAGAVTIGAPFAASFGTNNAIMGQLSFSSTLWAAAFGFVVVYYSEATSRKISTFFSLSLLSLLAVPLILAGLAIRSDITVHPYRTVPYGQQNSAVAEGMFKGMLLTETEAKKVSWLQSENQKLSAQNAPSISLMSPGNLLAFNNSGFASPWVDLFWPVSINSISKACEQNKPNGKFFILMPDDFNMSNELGQGVNKQLQLCGFDFTRDFNKIGTLPSTQPSDGVSIYGLKN